MHNRFLVAGAFLGLLAVLLGAFGAHGLKKITEDEMIIQSFQTGVQYQMYHSVALMIVALVSNNISNRKIRWAGFAFISGVILFSGSLYFITFLKIQDSDLVRFVGPITPVGGIFFLIGWVLFIVGLIEKKIKTEVRE